MKGLLVNPESGDLLIHDKGMQIGETDVQVAERVIVAFRGEFKENPSIGGEIKTMLGGERDVMWPGKVKKMLRSCLVDANRVIFNDGEVTIS